MRKILIFLSIIFFATVASAIAKDVYYCPMHPSYTSDRPGTCPICNMSLVKKQDQDTPANLGDVPGLATIKIDAQKRQLIGVKTLPVEVKTIVKTIRVYGKVARDARWVYAQVFEYDRPFLYAGENPLFGLRHKAMIDIPSLPGQTFTGKVRLLEREIDPVTRTTLVRVQLDRWSKLLKQDMSANVVIKVDLGTSLVVPHSAVLDTGMRQVVFVDLGKGVIEPRTVVLGEKGDRDYQVISGLKQGEKVIMSGNFLIDSESRLKAVLENVDLTDQQAPAGGHNHGE